MTEQAFNVDEVALQIAERLRDKSTKQGRIPFFTGDLRKSIQTELIGNGRAMVGSNLNYARAVHDGRPAITIKPKRKKKLRFTVGGKTVFADQVHQPARKGKPFIREGAQEMNAEGYGFLDGYLEERTSEAFAREFKDKIHIEI